MSVLVANATPYVIWSDIGGLVGACRTRDEAFAIVSDLKRSFPHKNYVVRDVDGDLHGDTRTSWGPR